jgi:MSHA biogenesis protein MshO
MPNRSLRQANRGFTLVEAVMVIMITGIIAAAVAVFIGNPLKSYTDSARRARSTDVADVALRRIARDVRLALPNSLRVMQFGGINYIEFIITSAGGRYRYADTDGSSGGTSLSFSNSLVETFDVVGQMPNNPAILENDFVVDYNTGPDAGDLDDPNNAYMPAQPCTGCNRAKVLSVTGNVIQLESNPFGAASISTGRRPVSSPDNRFNVVPGGTKAVSFACPQTVPGNLNRYANYGFNLTQAVPGGSPALLASNVTCAVDYTLTANPRSGLFFISLTLSDSSGEATTLFQQIHVDNAP